MGKRRKQKHLTETELTNLKASCECFQDQLIVFGLVYTGMRIDELCHMIPWTWYSKEEQTITIPELDETGWHPKIVKVVKEGVIKKEYCSNRIIPVLNPQLTAILDYAVEHKLRVNMNPKQIWMRLNQLWHKNYPDSNISPHMLRHTTATKMLRGDHDITDVAQLLGHHNVAITWDYYVHSDSEHLLKSVRKKGGI